MTRVYSFVELMDLVRAYGVTKLGQKNYRITLYKKTSKEGQTYYDLYVKELNSEYDN